MSYENVEEHSTDDVFEKAGISREDFQALLKSRKDLKPPADWDGKYHHIKIPELSTEIPAMNTMLMETVLGAAPAPGTTQGASTNNWDTVYAIKFADANKSLAKPGVTPVNFSTSVPTATLTGKFSPWLLTGGGENLLHMETPVLSGKATYNGTDYDLAGVTATIELHLEDLPQPGTTKTNTGSGGTAHDFKTSSKSTGTEKPVSVTDVSGFATDPGFIVKAVIAGLFEQWFTQNLGLFTHSFGTIVLNETADKEQFQWMKPTSAGYAVTAQGTPDQHVFGLLSMTENRAKPATQQLSPNAIPEGQVAGFLISGELFMEKLIKPQIHTIFPGANSDQFELVNNGTLIRNKSPVSLETVNIAGKNYTPVMPAGHFQLSIQQQQITMDMKKVEIDFSPGIKIMMDYTCYSKIILETNDKGEQVLNYAEAGTPIEDHNVETASWVTWTEVAASVAVALLTLGFGAWAKKGIESLVKRVIAIVIVLIVGELVANLAAIIVAIAEGEKNKLPPVNLAVANSTDPIKWPDSKDFLLTSAGLNESLQFGGNPQFT